MTHDRWLLKVATILAAIAALGLWLVLQGCVRTTIHTVDRQNGFNAQLRAFQAIPADKELYREAEIRVKVIVTNNIGMPGAMATYSHPDGVIRIKGAVVGGKVVLCESIIGHEILHALEYQAGGFVNPDRLSEIGF